MTCLNYIQCNLFLVAIWEPVYSNFLYCQQLKMQIYTLTCFLKFSEEEKKIKMDCSSDFYSFLMTINNLWTQIPPILGYTSVIIDWYQKMKLQYCDEFAYFCATTLKCMCSCMQSPLKSRHRTVSTTKLFFFTTTLCHSSYPASLVQFSSVAHSCPNLRPPGL